jgi:hypothetical protein
MPDPSLLPDQELPGPVRPKEQKLRSSVDEIPLIARRLIVWSAISGAAIAAGIGAFPILHASWQNQSWILKIIQQHYAATVGLPEAAILAFLIVITFEARSDSIEMEFFGILKFKGASGPIVLWAFCVLTITCCIKLLW